MKKLVMLACAAIAFSSFGETYYGSACVLNTADGWYSDSALKTLCGVAPGPGVTNVIQSNKSAATVKSKTAATYTGDLLILGNESGSESGSVQIQAGLTLNVPNCQLRNGNIFVNNAGTITVNGRYEIVKTSNVGTWTRLPRMGSTYTAGTSARNVVCAGTVFSEAGARLRFYTGCNDDCTAINTWTLSGDFSGYKGQIVLDQPRTGNASTCRSDKNVRAYFKSASSMGDTSEVMTDAVTVGTNVILEIDTAVTQSANRGITFNVDAGAKVFLGTTKVNNWTLSAPCASASADAILEKIDTGTVTLNTAIPMKNIEVTEGTLALGSSVSFPADTKIHVCVGAALTGTVPPGVTVDDDNKKAVDLYWTGLGSDELATTPQNWRDDTVGDYTSGLNALFVQGGTGMNVADAAASLTGVDLQSLPAESAGFRFSGTDSLTVGKGGLVLPAAVATERTYAFDLPLAVDATLDWALGPLTTVRFGGPVTLDAADTIFLAADKETPGAKIELAGNSADLKGGFSATNCAVVVSAAANPFGTGSAKAILSAEQMSESSPFWGYWWTGGALLTVKAPGCDIGRPVRFYTTIANVRPVCYIDAEAYSTNHFTTVEHGRGGGAMLYTHRYGANSYTKIDTISTTFANAIKLYGPGELEVATKWTQMHAYKKGTGYRYFQLLDGLTLTLSGETTEFATITVEKGSTLRLKSDQALHPKDRLLADTQQGTNLWLEVHGTLDLCGIDHALNGLTGTGVVVSATGPAKISASYVASVDCPLDFGTGVSLSVTNGTYVITGASTSDGVLEVAETGTLKLGKGAHWPNGTLKISAGKSVELARGYHKFDKLIVNGEELPPGVYGAGYANPKTDGYFTGSGRVYVGGCVSGMPLIVR